MTQEEQERVAAAIRDAEDETAGEIVVVVAERASDYRSIPLLWALLAALAVPWPLIAFTALGPSRLFLVQLGVALALSALLALPRRRHVLAPRFIRHARAHEAAMREFARRGIARTRARTGVLIYVALTEHYAAVLADAGIAERVGPEAWSAIVADLTAAIGAGRMAEGLVEAVRRAGAILARHAPPGADDDDELPNRVILL